MSTIALISQALRADHCRAFLDEVVGTTVIFTTDPPKFDEMTFLTPPEVVRVSPPPDLLPSKRLARGRLFQAALERTRRGSRFGRWLERSIKRFVWRLRFVDRAVRLVRVSKRIPTNDNSLRASVMYQQLAEQHETDTIDRIVVFDVFDLPVAVTFGEDYDLEVIVR